MVVSVIPNLIVAAVAGLMTYSLIRAADAGVPLLWAMLSSLLADNRCVVTAHHRSMEPH